MADPLSTGLNDLAQGFQDYAKAKAERDKAEATAIGNRGLFDIAVKSGALDINQQTEFLKANHSKQNDILAGAMRTWNAQREIEQDKMRQQAFQLQQNQDKREAARFNYLMPPQAAQALDQSGHVAIPTGPGQYQILAKPRPTPTQEQMAQIQSEAEKAGGSVFQMPDGTYRFEKKPAPVTPPMPTIPVSRPDGTTMDLPMTNPAAQEELKRQNPAAQAFSKFGANPTDFLPQNVVQGEIPFNDPKKYQFDPKSDTKSHVMLKNLGTTMTNAEYSEWLRKFAAAGQFDGPVDNPVTGETIKPNQQVMANRSANPRVLDPSNSASVGIMQGFIKQANGDINAARDLAHAQGYIW